jgi:hypothetical protein
MTLPAETEVSAQEATRTHYCKFGECTNEVRGAVGRWAYCAEHQGRANENPGRATDATAAPVRRGGPKPDAPESMVKRLAALQKLAREADAWQKKAEEFTRRALEAKRASDQARHAFAQAVADLEP